MVDAFLTRALTTLKKSNDDARNLIFELDQNILLLDRTMLAMDCQQPDTNVQKGVHTIADILSKVCHKNIPVVS